MTTTSLAEAARTYIERARAAANGHSARTVHGASTTGSGRPSSPCEASLVEHQSPREATLQVLAGHVRLTAGGQSIEAVAGDLLPVPAPPTCSTRSRTPRSCSPSCSCSARARPCPPAPYHRPAYSWQGDWT